MKTLFYDTEIIKCIPEKEMNPKYQYCAGWTDYENMGISVIGFYADWLDLLEPYIMDNKTFAFTESKKVNFQRLVNQADRIVGFNSIAFDDNLLKANGFEIETTYDLLCEVREATGQPRNYVYGKTKPGYSLEKLSQANLDRGKSGSGELAPKLWQDGKYNEVCDYCLDDVKLLVDLYEKRKELIDPNDGKVIVCKD